MSSSGLNSNNFKMSINLLNINNITESTHTAIAYSVGYMPPFLSKKIFFEKPNFFKIVLYICKRNQNSRTMEKVFISVSFGKFKKTRFTEMSEAIAFVKENKLSNTRLKLTKVGSVEEWDNF